MEAVSFIAPEIIKRKFIKNLSEQRNKQYIVYTKNNLSKIYLTKISPQLENGDLNISGKNLLLIDKQYPEPEWPPNHDNIFKHLGLKLPNKSSNPTHPPDPEVKSAPPPEPEVKPTLPPEPEVKHTPSPSPEIKETPPPEPEVNLTPSPSPEVKATHSPSPEVKSAPPSAPEVKSVPATPTPSVSPSLQKFLERKFYSENNGVTCYLNTVLVSTLAFQNTYFINKLQNLVKKKCRTKPLNCDSYMNIVNKLNDIHNDLINTNSKKQYGLKDNDPYKEIKAMLLNCSSLSCDDSGFCDSFEAIDFIMRMIVCDTIESDTKLDEVTVTSGLLNIGKIFYGNNELLILRDGFIPQLIQNFNNNVKENPEIVVLSTNMEDAKEDSKWNELKDNDKSAYKSLLTNPNDNYNVLSLIIYTGGSFKHYTCFIHNVENDYWLYFDSFGLSSAIMQSGSSVKKFTTDEVMKFLDRNDFTGNTILYLERKGAPVTESLKGGKTAKKTKRNRKTTKSQKTKRNRKHKPKAKKTKKRVIHKTKNKRKTKSRVKK